MTRHHLRKILPLAGAVTAALALWLSAAPRPGSVPLAGGATRPTTAPVPTAAPPRWRPGLPQYGIDILFYDDPATPLATLQGRADRTAAYLETLHANAAAIAFPIYTPGPDADQVRPGPATPTPTRLEAVATRLTRHGFRVTWRPLLDEANLTIRGAWRGTIHPTDRTRWFSSYRTLLRPYLIAARNSGTTTFDLGSELQSLETDPAWNTLATWARSIFPREVAYAQNWGTWQHAAPHPPTVIGVDAYPPMPDLPDTAPLTDVTARWTSWLASRPGTPADLAATVLQEVGIPAQAGAYKVPYSWRLPGHRPAPLLQATWFAAACQAQHNQHMDGIYYWAIDLNTDPFTPTADLPPTALTSPSAQAAIRTCFKTPYAPPGNALSVSGRPGR